MSFNIALSGINAINNGLETISNNIANAGTYGYKASRANFASMYAGNQPSGVEVGSITQSIGKGGSVLTTGRGLDVAIQGRGFFTTRDTNGAMMFSRVGIFSVDQEGFIVDTFGRKAQGYAAIPNSTALGAMGDLKVPTGQIPAQASDTVTYVGNLSADWPTPTVTPFDPANPSSFNSATVSVVYDSLGKQHTVTQYFVRSDTSQFTVHYAFDGAAVATTSTLDFGTDGRLQSPAAPVPLALGTPDGAEPLTVSIDYAGTTQYAGEAVTLANTSNGNASGLMTGVQISENGSVMAQYSNGQKQRIGTLAIATFPNEDGLVAVSDTSWTTSNTSGNPLFSPAGVGMAGSLAVGAIEQSNVDVASELVNLMSSQRNYQANSKVISTGNQMMQALMQAV